MPTWPARSTPSPQPVIDLIIPARNEEPNVPALFAAIPRHLFRHIIVVDNGSTDRTADLAAAAGAVVLHEPQRGYGAACLAALDWLSKGDPSKPPPDLVAFLDADLSDDPAFLPQLCAPIVRDEADLVIASRPRLAAPGALTPQQRFGNALACTLIRLLTGRLYTDLGPMRAIRWSSVQRLGMSDRTWGWTVEMQFMAAALRPDPLRTLEIHAPYRRRHAGKSKIAGSLTGSLRAGAKILTTIARLWWQSRRSA